MTDKFYPITNQFGEEVKPTRHRSPIVDRFSTSILRHLADLSRPTIERRSKASHVKCTETEACLILVFKPGEGFQFSAGLPGYEHQHLTELHFDTFDDLQRSKLARALVETFVHWCRVPDENPPDVKPPAPVLAPSARAAK